MAHHSSDGPFSEQQRETIAKMQKALEPERLHQMINEAIGPTDRHPEPKLGDHDEGEIAFKVGTMRDAAGEMKIFVDFGTPVHSIGMNKSQACELGRLLINRAGYACTIQID